MKTLALIILAAFGLLLALFVIAVGGFFIAMNRRMDGRKIIQPLIRSRDNLDIIGDGAWEVPSLSAGVRDIGQGRVW